MGWRDGVRDAVLARDDGAVNEAGGDVVGEVAVDGWDDGYVGGNGRDG